MSRTVCIWIPQFELRQRLIDLGRGHVSDSRRTILLCDSGSPLLVKDACTAARYLGVKPSMTIDQAHALCPEALFIYPDSRRFQDLQKRILMALYDFSPNLGSDNAEAFFLFLDGLERLHSNLEKLCFKVHDTISTFGLPAVLAIADSPLTSWLAAHHLKSHSSLLRIPVCHRSFPNTRSANTSSNHIFTIVPPRHDPDFLRKLPLETLPLSASLGRFFDVLGLIRVADTDRLPSGSLVRRFGRLGSRFESSLRGKSNNLIDPFVPERLYEEEISLDAPTNDLKVLGLIHETILDRLLRRVCRNNLCIASLEISLFPSDSSHSAIVRRIRPTNPTQRKRVLLDLVLSWLRTAPFTDSLSSVLIRVLDLKNKPLQQLGLFEDHRDSASAAFSKALSRLETAHGKDSLLSPLLNDCYLPEHRISWVPFSSTRHATPMKDYAKQALVPVFDLIDPPRSITLIDSWIYFDFSRRGPRRSSIPLPQFSAKRKRIVHRRYPIYLDHKWWKIDLSARRYEILFLEDKSHVLIFHDRGGSFLQAYID